MAAIPTEMRAQIMITRASLHRQVQVAVSVSDNAEAVLLAAAWLLLGQVIDLNDGSRHDLVNLARDVVKAAGERKGS